jgi:hypothetical protein
VSEWITLHGQTSICFVDKSQSLKIYNLVQTNAGGGNTYGSQGNGNASGGVRGGLGPGQAATGGAGMSQTNSAPSGGGMLTGTNATPGIQSNLIMQTSYQKQNQQ